MSTAATRALWGALLPESDLLTLLAIADHADSEATAAPKTDRLAWMLGGLDRRTIGRRLHRLARAGYITQTAPAHRHTPPTYRINIDAIPKTKKARPDTHAHTKRNILGSAPSMPTLKDDALHSRVGIPAPTLKDTIHFRDDSVAPTLKDEPNILGSAFLARGGERTHAVLEINRLTEEQINILTDATTAAPAAPNGAGDSTAAPASKPKKKRKRKPSGEPVADDHWTKKACRIWIERMGGTAPGARIGRALKPLVEKHGETEVLARWTAYLAEGDPTYKSAERFGSTYGVIAQGAKNGNNGHQHRGASPQGRGAAGPGSGGEETAKRYRERDEALRQRKLF